MRSRAEPPRLQAYLERTQGRSAFATPRSQWDSLPVNSTQVVTIDVTATPMHGVAHDASVIAVVASQTSTGGGHVLIYRHDPNDEPTPVNVDHYSVWTDLASHPRIQEFVTAASTSLNSNLERYLQENVLWVMEESRGDHWLAAVPSSVITAIRIGESDTIDRPPTVAPGPK